MLTPTAIPPLALPQVLIVSYETFRIHADRFSGPGACDLLICDEAHRSAAAPGCTACNACSGPGGLRPAHLR